MASDVPGYIYLIHFDQPLHHAQHYLGWTSNLEQRVEQHLSSRGSALLAAVLRAGGNFRAVRIWRGTRHDERRLHAGKWSRRLCPLCSERPAPVAFLNDVSHDFCEL